jgi:hypothetical protein
MSERTGEEDEYGLQSETADAGQTGARCSEYCTGDAMDGTFGCRHTQILWNLSDYLRIHLDRTVCKNQKECQSTESKTE